jgi:hypothetical protein
MAVNAREYALNWLAQTEVEHANERVLQLAVNNKARVTSNE